MKTETIFSIILVMLAAVGGWLFAPGRELALADIILIKVVSVAVFMSATMGLLFALRGIKYNVLAEVYDQNNTAGAVFTGLIIIALALVVGK